MGSGDYYVYSGSVAVMLRFAFIVVLAMLARSSVLLAEGDNPYCDSIHADCRWTGPSWTRAPSVVGTTSTPYTDMCPAGDDLCEAIKHRRLIVETPSYMISGRPKDRDDQSELTATKGDIDALNKRLDHIEELMRREACRQQFGATAYCP